MAGVIGHFRTITKHRHKVIRNCFRCGILWQGLRHDLSKYSPTEFIPGARFYTGKKSPTEGERESYGYSRAWMHHKGRNRHHYEYWTDYNPKTREMEPVEMPFKYLAEMFCDRVAAGMIYNGKNYTDSSPLQYFEKGKAKSYMHPNTAQELELLLRMLADKGEDETFAYIKRRLRKY